MNLAQLLHRAAAADHEAPAIALGPRTHATYGTLAGRVAALAGALRTRFDLHDGERVALLMTNTPAFVEVLFACWHAGLVAVPVNAKLHPQEVRYILDHSGARLCFATPALADAIAAHTAGLAGFETIVPVSTATAPSHEYHHLVSGAAIPVVPRADDDLAWLFYTSGTTGRPKGAMLSHRNLRAMTLSYFADVDAIAPDDCILHAAPMSHGSGLYILPHVAAGARQVIPESGHFDPDEILSLFQHHQGVGMFAAPTMVKRLVERAVETGAGPGNLKTIVYGGGPMYVEDLKRAMACFGDRFVQIYGQGESPMTITVLGRADHTRRDHPRYQARLGSVGRAHSVVEVRVADAHDRTRPPDELGEILVRGDAVMHGYWNDAEASARTLRGGWLHTGDMGAFDADGYLTLKDRSKDVIISGGANIYPREVEEALSSHPAVLECAVVGRPDPQWGEAVVAFVVTRPGHTVAAADLDALCLTRIARFKRPRDYRFVERLPKNNYGKVLKTELRTWAAHPADAE
ncbi:MAG: long-chain fatty acid--CoA ligase [Alphaproteobacteria bacterium]|nr:MAG: long-chain fatty acid--CoA ligase [Alphaproteobacteria bacterium]